MQKLTGEIFVPRGMTPLNDAIGKTVADVLRLPREPVKTAADVRDMRARIEQEKGTKDIWDIKYHRGGLVDVEFITQYLQLIHAHDRPDLLDQNTARGLEKLRGAGLLAQGDAEILLPAAHLYHDLTQILRLCAEGQFKPDAAPDGLKAMLAAAASQPDFAAVEALLREKLEAVTERFDALIV